MSEELESERAGDRKEVAAADSKEALICMCAYTYEKRLRTYYDTKVWYVSGPEAAKHVPHGGTGGRKNGHASASHIGCVL